MSLVRRAAVAAIAAGISFSAIVSGGQLASLAATTARPALQATSITVNGAKRGAVFQGAVTGTELIARINGKVVAKVTDTTYANGDAGLSTSGWYRVQFTNLRVTSQPPA